MFAYQYWADTTTGILKQRNSANTAWISLWTIATGAWLGNAATSTLATTATNQSGGTVNAVGGISRNSALIISDTAPTIAGGFGTSPSIIGSNGSLTFTINIGTGGTASDGSITMPAAPNGWNCIVACRTTQADGQTKVINATTTSITLFNYTVSTANPKAWASGQVLHVICFPY
jgi:hypothetical protein